MAVEEKEELEWGVVVCVQRREALLWSRRLGKVRFDAEDAELPPCTGAKFTSPYRHGAWLRFVPQPTNLDSIVWRAKKVEAWEVGTKRTLEPRLRFTVYDPSRDEWEVDKAPAFVAHTSDHQAVLWSEELGLVLWTPDQAPDGSTEEEPVSPPRLHSWVRFTAEFRLAQVDDAWPDVHWKASALEEDETLQRELTETSLRRLEGVLEVAWDERDGLPRLRLPDGRLVTLRREQWHVWRRDDARLIADLVEASEREGDGRLRLALLLADPDAPQPRLLRAAPKPHTRRHFEERSRRSRILRAGSTGDLDKEVLADVGPPPPPPTEGQGELELFMQRNLDTFRDLFSMNPAHRVPRPKGPATNGYGMTPPASPPPAQASSSSRPTPAQDTSSTREKWQRPALIPGASKINLGPSSTAALRPSATGGPAEDFVKQKQDFMPIVYREAPKPRPVQGFQSQQSLVPEPIHRSTQDLLQSPLASGPTGFGGPRLPAPLQPQRLPSGPIAGPSPRPRPPAAQTAPAEPRGFQAARWPPPDLDQLAARAAEPATGPSDHPMSSQPPFQPPSQPSQRPAGPPIAPSAETPSPVPPPASLRSELAASVEARLLSAILADPRAWDHVQRTHPTVVGRLAEVYAKIPK